MQQLNWTQSPGALVFLYLNSLILILKGKSDLFPKLNVAFPGNFFHESSCIKLLGGLTEAAATQKNLDFTVHANDLTSWLSSQTYAETIAYSKVLVEKGTGKIIGAHILGHHGEEMINLLSLAMKHDITSKQVKEMVFAYPTFSSDLRSMM